MRFAPLLIAILVSSASGSFAAARWPLETSPPVYSSGEPCARDYSRWVERAFPADRATGYICKKEYALAVPEITKMLDDKLSWQDRGQLYLLRAELYEKLGNTGLANQDRAAAKTAGSGGWAELRPNLTPPPSGLSNPQSAKPTYRPSPNPVLTDTSALPRNLDKRIALVIGNGAYATVTPLPNPRNDAEDVAAALKRSGFETIVGIDLDQTKMQEATIDFARMARDADVALFYYSGHAMQFAGVNYLMPVDARLRDEADLRRMARVLRHNRRSATGQEFAHLGAGRLQGQPSC